MVMANIFAVTFDDPGGDPGVGEHPDGFGFGQAGDVNQRHLARKRFETVAGFTAAVTTRRSV